MVTCNWYQLKKMRNAYFRILISQFVKLASFCMLFPQNASLFTEISRENFCTEDN